MEMIARAEDTLILLLIAAIGLLITVRLYRAVKEDEDRELATLKSQAAPRIPLRIVTEEDFDDAAAAMADDEKLAVQRRSEALNWFDTNEDFQRETA